MSTSSSRPSLFSRLVSSASSTRSNSSTYETLDSTPKGCREFQGSRYAKDGKGFDFNVTYPYSTTSATSSDADSAEFPAGCRDFKLRYSKDGKGHDFSSTYSHSPANYSMTLGAGDVMPRGARDFKNMRYAKDGKGIDFSKSYRYGEN